MDVVCLLNLWIGTVQPQCTLHCTVGTVLYCTVLYCTILYCTVGTVLYCIFQSLPKNQSGQKITKQNIQPRPGLKSFSFIQLFANSLDVSYMLFKNFYFGFDEKFSFYPDILFYKFNTFLLLVGILTYLLILCSTYVKYKTFQI